MYARFKDNMWAVNVAQMGSLPSKNQGVFLIKCYRYFQQTCLGQAFEG